MIDDASHATAGLPSERPPGRLAFAVFLAGLLAAHVISVFTENVNWDEFALLARAADTLATGRLQSGGRPGLATLILIPFVQGCADSVESVRAARLLWVGFTVLLVSGLWLLLARLLRAPRSWSHAVALGVSLLVLVPAFLRFSVQVRTDQPAIAFGLWAGVALLASRRAALWSLPAGAMLGVGYLFSQKLVYVAALVGLLAVGDLFLRRELRIRRELERVGLALLGGVVVVWAYGRLLPLFFEPARLETLSTGLSTFAHYRADFGFGFYGLMLPTLLPHLVLLALLVHATFKQPDEADAASQRKLLLSWGVIALGAAVLFFHAGALPYFWMTLGLFPATAIALGLETIQSRLPGGRERRIVARSIWAFLVVQAALTAGVLLRDTQRAQRESLAFIDRNFDKDQEGFHPERALFCREGDDPFPTVAAGIVIRNRYWGPNRAEQSDSLIGEFRDRPVAFMLDSFRLALYPPEITSFWLANYRRYYESVWLPTLAVSGAAGDRRDLPVLMPGTYRLLHGDSDGEPSVLVDGHEVGAGELVELKAGGHRLELLREMRQGAFVLAVDEPPKPATQPFYKPLEVIGFRW